MEKLLKKVRIYHLHRFGPPLPITTPNWVTWNILYETHGDMIEEKLTGIPTVKLASDRLFRSFFFPLRPALWCYGQRSRGGGWGAMGIRLHRTQSKRHLKAWPGFKAHPYMIKLLIITIRISSNLIVAVTVFFFHLLLCKGVMGQCNRAWL